MFSLIWLKSYVVAMKVLLEWKVLILLSSVCLTTKLKYLRNAMQFPHPLAKIAFLPTNKMEVCQSMPAHFFSILQGVSTLVSSWFLAHFLNAKVLFLAESITYLAPLEWFIFVERWLRDCVAKGSHFCCKHGDFFVANGLFLQLVCCMSSLY